MLPPFDALIIDEAHAFVDVSLDQLTRETGPARVARLLEGLPGGRLPEVVRGGEGESRHAALARSAANALGAARELFGRRNGTRPAADPRQRYRDATELGALCPLPFDLYAHALGALEADAAALHAFLGRREEDSDPAEAAYRALVERFAEETHGARVDLGLLLEPDPNDRDLVHWKEWGRDGTFSLRAAPVDLGPHLAPALERGPTRVVFTSATLAAGEDFGYFAAETGLGGNLHTLVLPSPFDFERQVLVLGLRGAPDPRDPGGPRHAAAILDGLMREVGRPTLALFTSYRDLGATAEDLSARGRDGAYSVLAQGEGESPAELLRRFRRERGLLLGTAGFWQGIDLPGEELEMLVLVRLPFGVPTDPRLLTRSERMEQEGGNPFMDLYLPEAVLRFKQGFGRLIRRRTDRGVVAVLDSRLMTRNYGTRFLRALPCRVEEAADGADLVARAAAWWRRPADALEGDAS